MLIIPSFSSININRNQQTNKLFASTSACGNLAPLKCDMVSFSGGKKSLDFVDENGEEQSVFGINKTTALGLEKEAKYAKNYLDQKLDRILGGLVRPQSGKGSSSKPIKFINIRIKSADSIIEKSITRKLDSAKEVKEKMTDIVGARIVMADSTKPSVDKVIKKLTEAVQSDQIKIIEIENYRPDPEVDINDNIIKSYDYASARALKDLKLACDDKLGTSIKKVDEDTPSGYMAIHMLVKLPNGFTGEIQIIGSEVEKLKEIEDICFKYKNGKKLKDIPLKVKKMLTPLTNKDDEILLKEYNIYTREAYMYQRQKEMSDDNKKSDDKFLQIPEYLPTSLDFNNIAKELNKNSDK